MGFGFTSLPSAFYVSNGKLVTPRALLVAADVLSLGAEAYLADMGDKEVVLKSSKNMMKRCKLVLSCQCPFAFVMPF